MPPCRDEEKPRAARPMISGSGALGFSRRFILSFRAISHLNFATRRSFSSRQCLQRARPTVIVIGQLRRDEYQYGQKIGDNIDTR